MPSAPTLWDIFSALAGTVPGMLVLLGLAIGGLVILLPLLLPEIRGWREVEQRVVYLDWGISVAAVLLGLGFFLVEIRSLGLGWGYGMRLRFALSGFFFAIAGRRVYSSVMS